MLKEAGKLITRYEFGSFEITFAEDFVSLYQQEVIDLKVYGTFYVDEFELITKRRGINLKSIEE